jgi:proline iminopeptidase
MDKVMKIISLPIIFITILLLSNCNQDNHSRENLLNNTPYIEDSLILKLPEVTRLCDNMNIEKKHVNVGDCNLYYEIEGDSIPLVLIHGGPGGTHHSFHPWLSGAMKYFKVIYYDQRGCGLSDYEAGDGYSFEQAVDDLERLRKALKIEKWIVLGHSFGGALAQYYSIKYPENLLGQVLVGSVPMMNQDALNGTRENDYLNESEINKKGEILNLFISGDLTLAQYLYNKDINGDWKRQNFLKPTFERQIQTATYDIISDMGVSADYGEYNFEHAFDKCPIPTLIVEGEYDLIWLAEKSSILKTNHPNAKLVVFENSGHNVYSDEPENFIEVTNNWGKSLQLPAKEEIDTWKEYTAALLHEQLSLINNSKSFVKMIKTEGIKTAKVYYDNFKKENPERNLFFEASLNILGYEYLFGDNVDESIEVFKLNVKEFPESWNVYDSLGEAYLKKGNKQKAITNYEKSVELNPENANGMSILKEIRAE